MITAHDLAKSILADKPEYALLDHYALSEAVRLWVSELYLSAYSRVRASEGLQLPINTQDRKQLADLQPHFTNFAPVVGQLELILSGQSATGDPFTQLQPQTTQDPSTMTQQQYTKWRESGQAPFVQTQGLLT